MVTTSSPSKPVHWSTLLITAVLITLFLFYIDEGRYTLSGLEKPGTIVAMALYLAGLLVGLFVMATLFAKRPPSAGRTALVLGLGSTAGVALTIFFIYVLAGFRLPTD
jgi:hypothetical protein